MLRVHKVRCKDYVMDRGAMTFSTLQPGRVYETADPVPYIGPASQMYFSILDEVGRNLLVPAAKFDILT